MPTTSLTPEKEQAAQELAARIRSAVDDDIVQLARLLVSKAEDQIFGQTEFEVRDIVHRVGAAALQTQLAQKKTATAAAASTAPTAAAPPASMATAPRRR
jgi:F420-0:gamma-glutamyl ligase